MNEFFQLIGEFLQSRWLLRTIYIAIAAVLLWILIRIYLTLRNRMIERLVYSRAFSASGVYETEKVTLTETVYNNSWFPLFFVNIEGFVYGELSFDAYTAEPEQGMQYFVSRFHLLPHMQTKRHHTITCKQRGYYRLETVSCLHSGRTKYFDAPAELYVYPRIIPFADVAYPTGTEQGEMLSQRRLIADPFQFSGVRDYRFGDPFNSINFKASAKSGALNGLRVNNRDFSANRIFMVYLNFQTEQDVTVPTVAYTNMMEYGLSYAAAILREAAGQGYRAGFASNCCLVTGETMLKFPIGAGMQHLEDMMKEMAKIRAKEGISFSHLMEQDMKEGLTDTEIFVLTSYLDDKIAEQFSYMELFGNYVNFVKLSWEGEEERTAPADRTAPVFTREDEPLQRPALHRPARPTAKRPSAKRGEGR